MNVAIVIRAVLTPIARSELKTRFDRDTMRAILADAFADFESQRSGMPDEPSTGGRLMVLLAATTIGIYRTLLKHGLSEELARSLTTSITGRAYKKMTGLHEWILRSDKLSANARVKKMTNLMRRFPFSPPSYDMVDVIPEGEVVAAFDVRRCPVAEHFQRHGLAELCVQSWCDLDYPLAETWGGYLQRSGTLASGASHCDFRWCVSTGEPDRRATEQSHDACRDSRRRG